MNKTDTVEIMSKRTTQVAMFSVVFVGMMLVFLLPNLIGVAQARIDATAYAPSGTYFSNYQVHMDEGYFVDHFIQMTNILYWKTSGSSFGTQSNGPESGYVTADLKTIMDRTLVTQVKFIFSNPALTSNSCDATSSNPKYPVECWISGGFNADAFYSVTKKGQQNSKNFCDILPKLGGLDQLKIIREKLHC